MKTMLNLAPRRGHVPLVATLLLAAALLGACGRSKECDKPSVVCADALSESGVLGFSNDAYLWIFSQSKPQAVWNPSDYVASLRVETLTGSRRVSEQPILNVTSDLAFIAPVEVCPTRLTLTVRDVDLARGTSVEAVRCFDAACMEADCAKFTLDRKAIIYPVENETQAKDAAPHVRCEGFTYRNTAGLPDITWNVRSYFSYKFKDEPSAISYRFASGPFLGPAITKPSDVNDVFDPDVTNPKVLVADTSFGVRLPMRVSVSELVPATGDNFKVLRAGWHFGARTVGCAMKQAVLNEIITTALNGASIGKNTLHIRFNDNDDTVPSGEQGWCSYFAAPGEEPAFQSYADTQANQDCALLK